MIYRAAMTLATLLSMAKDFLACRISGGIGGDQSALGRRRIVNSISPPSSWRQLSTSVQ